MVPSIQSRMRFGSIERRAGVLLQQGKVFGGQRQDLGHRQSARGIEGVTVGWSHGHYSASAIRTGAAGVTGAAAITSMTAAPARSAGSRRARRIPAGMELCGMRFRAWRWIMPGATPAASHQAARAPVEPGAVSSRKRTASSRSRSLRPGVKVRFGPALVAMVRGRAGPSSGTIASSGTRWMTAAASSTSGMGGRADGVRNAPGQAVAGQVGERGEGRGGRDYQSSAPALAGLAIAVGGADQIGGTERDALGRGQGEDAPVMPARHEGARPAVPLLCEPVGAEGRRPDGPAIARIFAAEIEGAVIAQVRGLLRQPEVVLGAWRAARAAVPDMTEVEARPNAVHLGPNCSVSAAARGLSTRIPDSRCGCNRLSEPYWG